MGHSIHSEAEGNANHWSFEITEFPRARGIVWDRGVSGGRTRFTCQANLVITLRYVTSWAHPRVHDCRWRLGVFHCLPYATWSVRLPSSGLVWSRLVSSLLVSSLRLSDSPFSSLARESANALFPASILAPSR